jgi:hypothetical protein
MTTPIMVPPPTSAPPVTSAVLNGGLFFREDESLKQYITAKHVVTFDQSSPVGGRVLPVYFRMSETEVRKRTYPFIMIDRLGWERDPERESRGSFLLMAAEPYIPDGTVSAVLPADTFTYKAQMLPIPISIRYQVTAWTRFKLQMMWVETQMVNVLPVRFGAINMLSSNYARDDDTVRRMDLIDSAPNDIVDPDNAGKRLFGRSWTVAISSEILPSDLEAAAIATRVVIDPSSRPGYESVIG